MFVKRAALALGTVALFLAPASAAGAAPNDQDTAYLRAAHQSNLAEIAGGRLAQQKGQSDEVKALGARFIADHTRLDAAVRETASALNVDLPAEPNPEQKAIAARYQAASGDAFDNLYIATQMDAHMKSMALGEKELAAGNDAQAKRVAQSAAPVIAAHHDQLTSAARALGLPSRVGTGTGGQAAHQTFTTPVVTSLGIGGVLLTAAAVLLLRRRRPVEG